MRVDTLAPGSAFRLPVCGLTGVVEHVSAAMIRVAITRPDGRIEHTAWSCATEVLALAADRADTAGKGVSAATEAAQTAVRCVPDAGNLVAPVPLRSSVRGRCHQCGEVLGRRTRRARYCSPGCRKAAWRDRPAGEPETSA